MKFTITQKFLSLTDSYKVYDYSQTLYLEVLQRPFNLIGNLDFYTNNGEIICNAKQELLAFPAMYKIYINNQVYAYIQKRYTFLVKAFDVDTVDGNYKVEGSVYDREFVILKEGITVARIYKEILTITDTYLVEIADGVDTNNVLAMAIVIDKLAHERKK